MHRDGHTGVWPCEQVEEPHPAADVHTRTVPDRHTRLKPEAVGRTQVSGRQAAGGPVPRLARRVARPRVVDTHVSALMSHRRQHCLPKMQ